MWPKKLRPIEVAYVVGLVRYSHFSLPSDVGDLLLEV